MSVGRVNSLIRAPIRIYRKRIRFLQEWSESVQSPSSIPWDPHDVIEEIVMERIVVIALGEASRRYMATKKPDVQGISTQWYFCWSEVHIVPARRGKGEVRNELDPPPHRGSYLQCSLLLMFCWTLEQLREHEGGKAHHLYHSSTRIWPSKDVDDRSIGAPHQYCYHCPPGSATVPASVSYRHQWSPVSSLTRTIHYSYMCPARVPPRLGEAGNAPDFSNKS